MNFLQRTLTLIVTSAFALSFSGISAVFAETLRVAHSSNPGQSVYIYWDELANRVNERADGALELKVFPSGQLGRRTDFAWTRLRNNPYGLKLVEQYGNCQRRLRLG